ncbi:RNA polymerase III subunit [Pseudozyma hubeiensis SY62]|uniref:RNA polymerase III subunit n=1 Tax=Pseudozyma hubeiensis (strain SY62) TaxID=1305764 RepID=R9PC89_PSEHS|nr:RNA polymerase III subunit [Pseudozyma hubeiensis SY62]GAC98822.1 RNA polymerase III subunit [Pseudozyma hubeiensis SY62]
MCNGVERRRAASKMDDGKTRAEALIDITVRSHKPLQLHCTIVLELIVKSGEARTVGVGVGCALPNLAKITKWPVF